MQVIPPDNNTDEPGLHLMIGVISARLLHVEVAVAYVADGRRVDDHLPPWPEPILPLTRSGRADHPLRDIASRDQTLLETKLDKGSL